MIDMCQECYDKHKAYKPLPVAGICDWCKCHSDDLKKRRDYEEGSCGRVYEVCSSCIAAQNEAAAEEMNELQSENNSYLDDDF